MSSALGRSTLFGTLWMLSQKLGAQIITLLVFIILARLLDAREFGLMAMANVVVLFLSVFASQGLTSAIIQRKDLSSEHINSAFWLNFFVGLTVCGVTWLAAPLISGWYGEPMVRDLIWVLSINVIFESLVSVQNSILQRRMAFKSIAIRKLSAEAISGIIGIGCALAGAGAWSLVAKSVSSLLLQAIIFWLVTDWRPQLKFSRQHAKDMTGYGINVLGVNVINFSARQLDDLFVGLLMGATVLGQYSIAKRLVLTAVDMIRGGIGSVAWTMFAKIQDDKARLRKGIRQINQWLCTLALPLFLGLSLFPEFYIPLLFGEKWIASASILRFLAIVGLLESIRSSHESLMLAVGKSGTRLKLALLLSLSNFAAFFTFYEAGIAQVTLAYAIIAIGLFPLWISCVLTLTGLRFINYLSSFGQAVAATMVTLSGYFTLLYLFPNLYQEPWLFSLKLCGLGLIYLVVIAGFNLPIIRARLRVD